MKEIMQLINDAIKNAPTIPDNTDKIHNNLNFLETRLSIEELKRLSEKYSNAELSSDDLSPLVDFLKQRWERIKGSNVIYSHQYHSYINQFCIRLAELLSPLVFTPTNKLLIPTLKSDYTGRLDKVVMSDDNAATINVLKWLTNNLHYDESLRQTSPSNEMEIPLSKQEKTRVIDFIPESKVYHLAYLTSHSEARLKKLWNNMTKKFGGELLLTGRKVLSTYGNEGWALLEKNIYNSLLPLNREQLVGTLVSLERLHWKKFLAHLNFDELSKIVLEGKPFLTVALDSQSYNGQENHDKVVALLFIDHYKRVLANRSADYSGLFGPITGYHKEQKISALDIPYTYLLKGEPLAGLSEHLKEDQFKTLLGPLFSGTVGKLTAQTLLLGNPDYTKTLQLQDQKDQQDQYKNIRKTA